MDANLMHISFESGILEDPWTPAPDDLFRMTTHPRNAPDNPAQLDIEFLEGIPVKVKNEKDNAVKETLLDIYLYLNEIGGKHGVGRIDIVENRFIGIKSRGVYETPGGTILHAAHTDLEIFTLDKEVYKLKKYLALRFAEQVYNGLWFSPESEYTQNCLKLSQKNVNGTVRVLLYKGHVHIVARKSTSTTFNQELASMEVQGNCSPNDADGFIKVNAIRLKEYFRLKSN
ncbi:Argininosuccinate synthase, partial [Stegodyphus mimosarum]